MSAKPKLLIDCDPGHDDAVAILYAAKHCELVGITTVHGNNPVENTTRNALAVLALGGIDVPLARGCARPLVQPPIHAPGIHGKSGLDGADLPEPARRPVEVAADEFIIETARAHQGALTVALIGPQTNLALAMRREPRLAEWLAAVTIMGGSTTLGNITPAAEFNVFADPEAAAMVFDCGRPLSMVGYNVTRRTGFDAADVARLRASDRRVAGMIAGLMEFYLGRQKHVYGLDVAPMHDVCAIVHLVRPELVSFAHTSVRVELAGTYTRGMTVCDLRGARPGAAPVLRGTADPNARVAIDADSRALIDHVLETLLTYP